ncbi:MAG: hypothetical protein HAW67_06110 [Endozoicomonadaceae bacterium]|nr:hypothetical protein [Endozoicomonadaceae bacterium]
MIVDATVNSGEEVIVVKAGEKYPLGLPKVEGVVVDFFSSINNRLVISLSNITESEVAQTMDCPMHLGLKYDDGALMLVWIIEDERPWVFKTPFNVKSIPTDYLQLPNFDQECGNLIIHVHVLEHTTGQLKAMRVVTIPPQLVLDLFNKVQNQFQIVTDTSKTIYKWLEMDDEALLKGMAFTRLGL